MADDCKRIELTADMFLDRSCIIYGGTASGKSHQIKHILYLTREYVPNVIVFSQSERNNGAYSKAMVPRCFVHDAVSEEVIHAIARRQTQARAIYERATNVDTLGRLFARVADRAAIETRDRMLRVMEEARGPTMTDIGEQLFKERLTDFYKRVITSARSRLGNTLDDNERFALKWMDFNPRITVVFDDCSTDLAKFKSCADMLEQIFQGRHFFCTSIIALHGESMVLPAMRSNVRVSIFTDPQIARQWATRPSNGFQKAKRDALCRYADRVIVGVEPHTKMLFTRDQAYLIETPPHGPFSAVSEAVREFARTIEKKEADQIEPWMQKLI